jgi:inhibitor of cysteine peptidase
LHRHRNSFLLPARVAIMPPRQDPNFLSRRTKLFLMVAFAVAVFCGPAISGDAPRLAQAGSAAEGNTGHDIVIQIGNADNGGRRDLRVGDRFEVTLPENPTTGYRWQLHSPVSPILEVEDDSFAGAAPGRVGAGGLRSWRFRTLKVGLARLVIDNRRSWEPAPIGTFEVTIDVKAQ